VRVAVFGDVHGNLPALQAVLAAVWRERPDAVLCTGDLVNYGPDPVPALQRALAAATLAVAGNHDLLLARWRGEPLPERPGRDMAVETACLRWTAERLGPAERQLLGALPPVQLWRVGALSVLLAHGSPASPEEYVVPELPSGRWRRIVAQAARAGARVVVLGHTHRPLRLRRAGVLFCNPGSVGWPKDGDPRASYGVLEVGSGVAPRFTVRRVAYEVGTVVAAMRQAGLPAAVAEAIRTGSPA
jgi:putative phosphoesterase